MLIGKSGKFILIAPFTQYANNGLSGKIVAVSYIQHMVSRGVDVKSTVYEPVNGAGLYTGNYNDNVIIVTIKAANGRKYEIPSPFIENLFDDNIAVIDAYITVKVPNMPKSYDFDYIKQQLATQVTNFTGVSITVNDIYVSGQESNNVYTKTEYDVLNSVRESLVSNLTTDYGKLVKREAENSLLKEKLTSLQNYVVNKLR